MFGGAMWWPNGFSGDKDGYYSIFHPDYSEKITDPNNTVFNLLTQNYSLVALPFEGGLGGVSWSVDYLNDFKSGVLSGVVPIKTEFQILTESGKVKSDGARWLKHYDIRNQRDDKNPLRWIESCNHLQRFDFFGISFEKDDNAFGRLEVSALSDYFVIRPEIYPHQSAKLGISIAVRLGKEFTTTVTDGVYLLKHKSGAGLVFVPLTSDVSVNVEDNGFEFFTNPTVFKEKSFNGFSVAVYPMKEIDLDKVNVLSVKGVKAKASMVAPVTGERSACFDNDYGYIKINAKSFGYQYGDLRDDDNLKKMDRLTLSLENPIDKNLVVPVMFERNTLDDFNPTGMCPILRDADTLIPLGVPIRRTNNWHLFTDDVSSVFYAPKEDPRRSWQGIWYHGFAYIELLPRQTKNIEYTCTYATWGKGAFPVSHANLSLVGYNGNQQWEQSAISCFGESICYDPEVCLGRGNIDDIRPFQMDCKGRCEWAANVGGGDFLFYYDKKGYNKRLKNMRTYYRSQGPNMTDVTYLGQTVGDAINAKINVRMGRTDDLVRIWYELEYEFVKDVDAERIVYFQLGADNYTEPRLETFSYGNLNGVIKTCPDGQAISDKKYPVDGEGSWWFFSKNTSGQKGNWLVILREFGGEENGEKSGCYYRIGQTHDAHDQACLEIVPKNNLIKKGSKAHIVLEFIVMPGNKKDYYGDVEYLKAFDDFDSPDMALYQAQKGVVSVTANVGTVKNLYPIVIETSGDGVVADFTVSGGVAYLPLVFENVKSNDCKLQVLTENGFQTVDQSLYGNDFWQCEKDGDTYTVVYNVKTNGQDCRYRLILTKEGF